MALTTVLEGCATEEPILRQDQSAPIFRQNTFDGAGTFWRPISRMADD
jgi:hypothetical protein